MIRNEKEAELDRWTETLRDPGGERGANCVRLPASLFRVSGTFFIVITTLRYRRCTLFGALWFL